MAFESANAIKFPLGYNEKSSYVLGVDFARFGRDQTALVIVEQPFSNENIFVSYIETMQNKPLNEVIGRILYLYSIIDFRKVICDVTGLGAGPVDVLKEKLGGIVEGVTFTAATKADMFYNLKLLLQQKKLCLPDHRQMNDKNVKQLFYQFLTIKQEFRSTNAIPLFSHENNTHDDLICSLALACLYFRVGRRFRKSSYSLVGKGTSID
jgi:phage FluMu gp28-like protein